MNLKNYPSVIDSYKTSKGETGYRWMSIKFRLCLTYDSRKLQRYLGHIAGHKFSNILCLYFFLFI